MLNTFLLLISHYYNDQHLAEVTCKETSRCANKERSRRLKATKRKKTRFKYVNICTANDLQARNCIQHELKDTYIVFW